MTKVQDNKLLEKKIFNELRYSGPLCPGQLSVKLHTGVQKILEILRQMQEKSIVFEMDEELKESASLSEDELKYRSAWGLSKE